MMILYGAQDDFLGSLDSSLGAHCAAITPCSLPITFVDDPLLVMVLRS